MKNRIFLALACCGLLSGLGGGILAAQTNAMEKPGAQESAKERAARMKWFDEARFGLFIHWGLYSQAAGEWDGKPVDGAGEWILNNRQIPVEEYAKLIPQFNPVKFDAKQWVRLAKNAGMKYIVITSKHHDGFGMYRSGLTDWCIKSTPFQRDPLKELAAACKDAGVRLCFYYSIMDWHHPDYRPARKWVAASGDEADFDRYVDYMKGQLKELLAGYGPIGILWFDGEWEKSWTPERGEDLCRYVRSLQPGIIVNNRVGKSRAGMAGMDKTGTQRAGDYGTPEQEIPANGFGPGVEWESCMTMNQTWGYKKNDEQWKSTETLIRNLIDCASKGGNYLLNVGPTGEGLIPDASAQRLVEVGRWMKVNGKAIHDTTANPFSRQFPWGRCTAKMSRGGATLYFHVFQWPANGQLLIPGLRNKTASASLLANKKSLATESTGEGMIIHLPAQAPDPISSTVVLRLKRPLSILTGGS
jgi:alpha-L-fucosidase